MDQDFHYYGTFHAARAGGFNSDEAKLIAKAANFIDFFNETTYAAYWKLVTDTAKTSNYNVVALLDYPRYTFQGGFLSTGLAPEDGLWCSYHFTPGNYKDPPNTPDREAVHGPDVAHFLPRFEIRDTNQGRAELRKYPKKQSDQYLADLQYGNLLNRPQSALSRQLIMDAILCATDDARLESILGYAIGGRYILKNNREDNLRRFRLILLGIRSHVIADTWAHQDFCGIGNVLNTYWDVNYDPNSWDPSKWGYGLQSIDYDDGTAGGWKNIVLSSTYKLTNRNFEAVPNDTSYLGHGWMGHLPDFSFVKFRYKPCWANPTGDAVLRNNPEEYKRAWVELASLFNQAHGNGKLKMDENFNAQLKKAESAIDAPCRLENSVTGRNSSANAWSTAFGGDAPLTVIDVDLEPDANAVLDGMIEMTKRPDRYGTDYVNIVSDLYLFQIAADYHFHFVKHYLKQNGIRQFTGSWSQQTSALSPEVTKLFLDSSEWGPGKAMAIIKLYKDNNFKGREETFDHDVENLKNFGFNDETSSCKVIEGAWLLYKDANFQGDCSILPEGNYGNPEAMKLSNDSLSSFRALPDAPVPTILLFEDSNYRGRMVVLTGAESNFKNIGFNDKVSSIIVLNGTWALYKDSDFSGTTWQLDEGRYPAPSRFDNDSISSAKPI